MITLYCVTSFLLGALFCTLFKKTIVVKEKEKELPYEEFDPLAVYKENKSLLTMLGGARDRLKELEASNQFYSNKFKILQKACREKNTEFVLHEIQRMNYEEDNRPRVIMSGFCYEQSPFHSAMYYEPPQIGYKTSIANY